MEPTTQFVAFQPIGLLRSSMRTKFDAPTQPNSSSAKEDLIEIFPDRGFDIALSDLGGFTHIWLISWFNRNTKWRSKVLPPRGKAKRRGVFGTRSPHRPNPIGISAVKLLRIEGLKIFVSSTDLIDQTPILDIKPYIPGIDSFPEAGIGWLQELETELKNAPVYMVTFTELAETQLLWLEKNWGIRFIERAQELLQRDPFPHRTRRIRAYGTDRYKMGCGAWRLIYSISGKTVRIEQLDRGYPQRLLIDDSNQRVPDREAQIAFGEIWKTN